MHIIHQFLQIEEQRNRESDLYAADTLDMFVEDDEISAEEEGFMHGYLRA